MTGRSSIAPDVLDAIATMREDGLTWPAISEATGLPPSTCEYHALRLGAFSPASPAAPRSRPVYVRAGVIVRPFDKAEDASIQGWALQGVTLVEMGRRLGRKHNAVLQRLRSLARHQAEMEAAS